MQSTESLSLSALIMWTNQCLLDWVRLVRPQWRLNDEGTHLPSVRGPPTFTELSRHVSECEETSTRTLKLHVNGETFSLWIIGIRLEGTELDFVSLQSNLINAEIKRSPTHCFRIQRQDLNNKKGSNYYFYLIDK